MHNLFLGTARRVMDIWLEKKILRQEDLKIVQNKVDATHVPCNIGRMPFRIASLFRDLLLNNG